MTGTSTRASDFFVAGGTLDSDSPSYVKRPADDDLFNLALAGEFCFVLTPRQMGKSSLMIRTAHRLAGQGVRTAIIDLTGIGTDVSAEQWYLGLITRLKVQMKLCVDPDSWWGERASLSPVQRFLDFLRDVVLAEIEGPVVIFVDEIDTTLNLDFSDDFFAAIRFTYNARAVDSAYYRLTFVLLGVAAPADLIKDPSQTPFNIGHGIDLHEFDLEDAKVLQQGLETVCPKQQARAIFSRIFYWTNGHPYLTQKLCLGAAERESEYWADANVQVDGLVEALFLSDEARKESNLQFVRDRILTYPQRRRLLALYRRVYRGGRVADDKRSLVQNQLKLSGLVRAEDRRLHIRNEIYRRAFDLVWVRENTAIDWAPIFLGIIVFGITLGVGIFVYNGWVGNQLRDCIASFYQTDVPTERLTHLARMFKLRSVGWGPTDHDYRARELFYGLPREGQLHLLNAPDVQDRDLTEVIRGLYVTLADVDGTGGTTPVLEAMAAALSRLDDTTEETANLTNEIDNWLQGREFITKNQYDDALVKYNRAIESNGENPSTLFERARVLAELSDYEQALSDFDRVMAIAGKAPNPTPVPSPSPVPTPSLLAAPGASPSLAITSTSTLGKETPTVQTPSPSESASLIAASPIASVTAVPITSPTPTETAAPTAAAEPVSIASEFMTFGQIVRAVRNLIYDNPYLISTLARVPHTQYANLREFGLAPTPTSTIMPTNTPTRDYPWDVRTATTTITRPPPTPTPTVAPTTALIPRTLVSHFFPAAPGIDGDLSEWDMFTDVVLDAMTAESIRGLVSSSEDASAILRSGWDDNFLYFALEIRDDLLVADSEEIWRDDSVELGLDGLFDHVGRQEDDHQFILNLDGRVVDFGRDTTAVTAITRTLSGGWAMEIAIAAEGIGAGALAAGKEMGFTFGLHDDDDGGDWDSYLVWEGDSTNNSSAEYGRLLLSDEAVGPIPTATNTSAVVNTLIVTPTPTSTPDEPAPVYYLVQPGDTLRDIAVQFGVTVEAMMETNDLDPGQDPEPGQSLAIPHLPVAVVIPEDGLSVRSGPGAEYGRIAVVERDERLVILGRNETCDWLKIAAPPGDITGWVMAEFVESNVSPCSPPIAVPPPRPTQTVTPTATPTPTLNSSPLASNTRDFSSKQGGNQWWYLIELRRNSEVFIGFSSFGSYQSTDGKPDRNCWLTSQEGVVRICEEGEIHPGATGRIAYRWHSDVTRNVRVAVHAHKIDTRCGDGIWVGTYAGNEGQPPSELGEFTISGDDYVGISANYLAQISENGYVLVIVDIRGDATCDQARLYIDIF